MEKELKLVNEDIESKQKILNMIDKKNFKKKFLNYLCSQVKDSKQFMYSSHMQQIQIEQREREQ